VPVGPLLPGTHDNRHMTNPGPLKTGFAGLVVVGLATLLAACGSSPPKGVASLATTATTSARSSAPAVTGGGAGGSGGPVGASGGGSSHMVMAGGNYSQMLKFAECMRSNGVADFPDPSGAGTISVDGLNPQSAQFQGAARVCRKLLPNGGQPSPAEQAAALAQALKLSQCMRAHGITDFPDPKTAPGGGISMSLRFTPGSDLNPGSTLFEAAQKACHSNIPGPAASPAG
jgi:hypothetical protein